jgi:tetratricopeptide (TPR) repeat protein
MRTNLTLILIVSAVAVFAACSGNENPPDANAVQVGDRSYENIPIADIPSEFVSAADALAAGKRLLDAGETARAIDALLQAVKFDPDLAEAYFQLGIAYSLVEADIDAAVGDQVTTNNSGKTAPKKKNSEKAFESAVDAYKKLIEKNKDDDVAHFYLGLTYNKLNKDGDAARELREAVQLKPENSEYQTELGSILIKLAKYHEAVAALKKALELDPSNTEAEELLEEAEAGRRRIDFVPPKEKGTGNSNTAPNANGTGNGKPEIRTMTNTNTRSVPPKVLKTPPIPSGSPR